MPNAIRSPRRILVLGLVISLGILGFALPRPASKAQEPVKAVDKKTLREQIVALHVEIDLLEVEQGVDRDAVSDLSREQRSILAAIDEYLINSDEIFVTNIDQMVFSGNQEQQRLRNWKAWGGELLLLAKAMKWEAPEGEFEKKIGKLTPEEIKKADDQAVERFGDVLSKNLLDELKGLPRTKNKEEYSRLLEKFAEGVLEQVTNKATENVRKKSASLKKDFTRRSAEIAGKKLDLDSLERQYRETR